MVNIAEEPPGTLDPSNSATGPCRRSVSFADPARIRHSANCVIAAT